MEELYKVMDDLLEVEFQMKAGMDILKELEEFYMLEKETEKSDARKVAVLMKGYLQSMKSNIREIIRYIDDTTLEKSNDKKKVFEIINNELNDKEKKVIELRLQEKTQYEIADILGLSQSYISRYLKSIMKKINKYF